VRWKLLIPVGVVVLGLALVWNVWGFVDRQVNTFRLKATATILVDGVPRTGSSVQEYKLVWNYVTSAWLLLGRGEGIVIDVPGEEPIYVQFAVDTVFGNCANRVDGQAALYQSLLDLEHCDVKTFPAAITFKGNTPVAVYLGKFHGPQNPFVSMSFERTNDSLTVGRMPPPESESAVVRVSYDGHTRRFSKLDFNRETLR